MNWISPVRQILIQGVAFFGSTGRRYGMIIVGQLRVILVSFASYKNRRSARNSVLKRLSGNYYHNKLIPSFSI